MPKKGQGAQSSDVEDLDAKELKDRERQATLIRIKKQFYFLTPHGILRLLIIFLSVIHIGIYGYYDTFYSKIGNEAMMPPVFAAPTRETFFMFVNCYSFLTTFTIVLACLINARSHASLLGSLYLFIFDFMQFLLIEAAAIGLLMMYQEDGAIKAYEDSRTTRQGLAITGILLGCLHLVCAVYDLAIYVWRKPK